MMIQKTKKNSNSSKGNRLLISINVLGSAGPLRFLVNEEELVAAVIETALRNYAREGRLPILGSDLNNLLLYSANAGTDALSPWETIGSRGGRNFVLCKKAPIAAVNVVATPKTVKLTNEFLRINKKGSGSWKSWINKSLSFKISSH
ncbi:hypothetical protein FRX31_029543 [Thalictrum thalictroides]|uniref:DUF7054 domain-containing protein n=1 Tax=Thalictrum thalictroides TaxID=46969 RepID=A0A7J6V912_THATH|nr:hypothetical protein FRX31_029543 [Thalictrum thalictroides]